MSPTKLYGPSETPHAKCNDCGLGRCLLGWGRRRKRKGSLLLLPLLLLLLLLIEAPVLAAGKANVMRREEE